MTSIANISEAYSLSECRSGRARVSRLVLTGWAATPSASAGLKAWSDDGRVWIAITGTDFSVRRRPPGLYVSTDEVCSGTISGGKVTLAADNTSGISGSADVDNGTPGTNPDEDATLDAVIGYADENDLARVDRLASSLLVSGTYPGGGSGTRFESLLLESKRKLDKWILAQAEGELRYDEWGRPLLAHIVRTGDFARCQALIAMHIATLARGDEFSDRALAYLDLAREEFKNISIQFDYERDGIADQNLRSGMVKLYRG